MTRPRWYWHDHKIQKCFSDHGIIQSPPPEQWWSCAVRVSCGCCRTEVGQCSVFHNCFRGWSSRLFEGFRSCFHRFHSFSIYSLRCGSVCVCSPGDAGRHWSSGLGMDGFPSFPHPMFMSIYVNDMSTGVFFAHHIAIRIPFRWLAAAVRFPGLLYVHALLLQAWSGISTFHDHLGSDRRNCVITSPLRTLFRGGPYQN